MDPLCSGCDKKGSVRCGKCHAAGVNTYYCGAKHQKSLWPTHKWFCGKKEQPVFVQPDLCRAEHDLYARTVRRPVHQVVSRQYSCEVAIGRSGDAVLEGEDTWTMEEAEVAKARVYGKAVTPTSALDTLWNIYQTGTLSRYSLDDLRRQNGIHAMRLFNHHTIQGSDPLSDPLDTSSNVGPSYRPFMTTLVHLGGPNGLLDAPKSTRSQYLHAGLVFFTMLDSAARPGGEPVERAQIKELAKRIERATKEVGRDEGGAEMMKLLGVPEAAADFVERQPLRGCELECRAV